MKKVTVFALLTLALVLAGCGGGGAKPGPIGAVPNATVNTGDAVNPAILKFEMNVTALTLTGVSPTVTTGNLLSKPAEVEFVHQAGTMEPLAIVNIPAGTYSGATLTVANPEVVVVNGTTPTSVPATLSSSTATVTFTSNVVVTATSNSVLNFDLDLAASVTLNGRRRARQRYRHHRAELHHSDQIVDHHLCHRRQHQVQRRHHAAFRPESRGHRGSRRHHQIRRHQAGDQG